MPDLKPEAAPSAISPYGVQNWNVLAHYSVMEGSGSRLANLGKPRNRPIGMAAPSDGIIVDYTTGVESAGTWSAGPRGMRLALGSTHRIPVMAAGSANRTFRRWAVKIDFTSTVNKADGLLHTFWQSSTTNSDGRGQFVKFADGNVGCRIRSASSNLDAVWPGASVDLTQPVQLVWTGSRKGQRVFLNGVEGTYSGGFENYTGGLVIHSGQEMRINHGNNPGLMTLDSFTFWTNNLAQREWEELLADPFINDRGDLSDSHSPIAAYKVGRVKSTQYAVRVATRQSSWSGNAALRLVQGAGVAAMLAASAANVAADTWITSQTQTGQWLYSTGNDAGAEMYFRVEERGSDGQYRPRAGGYQRVQLERSQAPVIAAGFEDHIGDRTSTTGTTLTPAFGTDITLTSASTPTENSAMSHKQKALHDATYAIFTQKARTFDIIVHIGDGHWFDNLAVEGLAAVSSRMFSHSVAWQNHLFRALKVCSFFIEVPGNHECFASSYLREDSGGSATLRQARVAWRTLTANPTADVYGIGEEGTQSERLPRQSATIPNRFRPGMTVQAGEIYTASGDDLRAYRVVSGSVCDVEPTWNKALGGVSLTGNVTFVCVPRWDSVTHAAYADDGSPTQTWFAFNWGKHSFFIADSESYSLVGLEDVDAAETPNQYGLGKTQKAAILRWAQINRSRGQHLHLFLHRLPGGKNYRATTTGWYGRDSGGDARDAAYYEAEGVAVPPDQIWLSNVAQTFQIVIYKGHDHHFCIAFDSAGVLYVTFPTTSAGSHAEPSFGGGSPSRGWRTSLVRNDYGAFETAGQTGHGGGPLERRVVTINAQGYCELRCHDTTGGTVRLIRTSAATKAKNGAGYGTRIRKDVDQCAAGPFTPDSDSIDLTNPLNPSPEPLGVAMVMLESEHAAAIMSGAPNEAATDAQADVTDNLNLIVDDELSIYSGGSAYEVGSIVVPDVPNGLLARVSAITTGVSAGSVSWPANVGSTVVDGGVTWVMIPTTIENRNDLPTSITLAAGTVDDVMVDYWPAVLYESDDLVDLLPGTSGEPGKRVTIDGDAVRMELMPELPPTQRLTVQRVRASGTGTAKLWMGDELLLTVATQPGYPVNWRELNIAGKPGLMLAVETETDTQAVTVEYEVSA